jgi:hypothetical protein
MNDAGSAIRSQRRTPALRLDDRAGYHEVGAVSFRTTAPAGTRFEVQVYGSERGENPSLLTQASATVSDSAETAVYLRAGARYLAVRLLNEEADREFGVSDMTVWVRPLEV